MWLSAGDFKTPRGIGIGSTLQDVLMAYVDEIEKVEWGSAIFYRYNAGSDSDEVIPPCGHMWSYKGTYYVSFSMPTWPWEYEDYTMEELEDWYIYRWHYSLSFTVEQDAVTRVSMSVGPFGE